MRELVGQGKPFYSSLDKAAGLLRRKVGTGAEFLKELMSIPGVKQTEVAERGLGELLNAPKMTHEQFLAALSAKPAPAISEMVLGEKPSPEDVIRQSNANARAMASQYAGNAENSREAREMRADELRRLRENHRPQMFQTARHELEGDSAPHHYKWTLPGGENYREMLIKAPEDTDEFPGRSQHFGGEPGILASLRLKDRTGPNGEKLLHLEELQSDWHQAGRERGYKDPAELQEAESKFKELAKQRRKLVDEMIDHEATWGSITPEMQSRWNVFKQIEDEHRHKVIEANTRVPDAPFKKNWEEMALKRLIHHAAEKGYHGIVITPGAEQADRYSLAKHIDRVELEPNTLPNKETHPYYFLAYDKNGRRVADDTTNEGKLQEYLGKDLATKLLSSEPTGQRGVRTLDNANLVTGGEGMKGFYDKKVPNILNGIGKKYGVKTELGGHTMTNNANPKKAAEDDQLLDQLGVQTPEVSPTKLHYFPITEEMRQDVKQNGIPLYESGGSVSTH